MYASGVGRDRLLKSFHSGRLSDFASFVGEPGGTCLSVGCGTGVFETEYISDSFDTIYAVEPKRNRIEAVDGESVVPIQAASPPVPFEHESFDCIVAAGVVEHIQDERGFIEAAYDSLNPTGEIYLTIPIEVGVGGFLRHLGRCYVDPTNEAIPDGKRRYFDYTTDELRKRVPREKHARRHRYYNYTYLLDDVRERFGDVEVRGWPFAPTRLPNLIYFVSAKKA
ncbi:class I SAM-dependent methyltransferase [Halobellus limi]|nr:class I SAM-dependent methyltransferase [Halobellus limi]SEG58516.1 Methyltransferase domain-containing protein [Halobellus limi]